MEGTGGSSSKDDGITQEKKGKLSKSVPRKVSQIGIDPSVTQPLKNMQDNPNILFEHIQRKPNIKFKENILNMSLKVNPEDFDCPINEALDLNATAPLHKPIIKQK